MKAAEALLLVFVGFTTVAGLTWFFSSRPRLFVRVFVPREELFRAGRRILRRTEFRRGMLLMAELQFGVACVIGLVALWLRI
ncbi:hypothetical protein [Fimbriiglobus ruber]|uniref:Uncharacterized protein n=1 Tax=Fimbriiglobus ruber TaxID=1908690 RepID=A0A225DQ47_9BACT|nr:hypothetical protein [Fimbriiglobus ruber]OWK38515.1 hypothetical protein FRUB_07635 [Fimbriiglobus ruber]